MRRWSAGARGTGRISWCLPRSQHGKAAWGIPAEPPEPGQAESRPGRRREGPGRLSAAADLLAFLIVRFEVVPYDFSMLPADGTGAGLFLTPVPVPTGDPGALSRAAATYASAHGEIDRNRAVLAAVGGQASGQAWTGTGATAYLSASGHLTAAYTLTAAVLARGAATLRTYASELAAAQQAAHQANTAVAVPNASTSAFLAAQATYEQSATAASQASDTATAAHAQAAASPHSPAARIAADNAQSEAEQAQPAASAAATRLSTLAAQSDADRARAVALSAQARQEAQQAASKAAAGFDAASGVLAGPPARPAPGGAHGVTGSSIRAASGRTSGLSWATSDTAPRTWASMH
jgi:hypothetical protein